MLEPHIPREESRSSQVRTEVGKDGGASQVPPKDVTFPYQEAVPLGSQETPALANLPLAAVQ